MLSMNLNTPQNIKLAYMTLASSGWRNPLFTHHCSIDIDYSLPRLHNSSWTKPKQTDAGADTHDLADTPKYKKLAGRNPDQRPGTFLMDLKPEYSEKYDSVPLLRSSSFDCTGLTSSMPFTSKAITKICMDWMWQKSQQLSHTATYSQSQGKPVSTITTDYFHTPWRAGQNTRSCLCQFSA